MTPRDAGPPKKGLMIIASPKEDGPPLDKPGGNADSDEPDADDMAAGDSSGEECSTCHAYSSDGRCLHFPPVGGDWARVLPGDWCAQYKAGPQHGGGDSAAPQATPPPAGAPSRAPNPGIGGY